MALTTKRFSIIVAGLAFIAVAALLSWLFSLQGTRGLFEWHPPWRRNFILIGVAGLLPLALGTLSLVKMKGLPWLGGSAMVAVTFVVSALALLLAGGLLADVLISARAVAQPIPELKLVDPAKGIPGSEGKLHLSLSSDPHYGVSSSDARARSAIIKSVAAALPRRDAFLILGDNVEMGMEDRGWHEEAAELSSLLGDMPIRPLLGNHDGLIDGQYHFERYFFPTSTRTDSGSRYYYSMGAGPAEIIVLDLLWGLESFDAAQAAWLERRLSSLPAGRQVIVLSHCFFYSSGYIDEFGLAYHDHPGTISRVAPILERHRVALVVSGHNHYMELLRHGGVTYAVIGAMGGLPDPPPSYRSPASLWFRQGGFGRLDLDIDDAGLALSFRDEEGALLHEDFIPAAN